MKVIIFGATGSIGRLAAEEMLKAGHTVSAFARHPERLKLDHPDLNRIAGDALNAEEVLNAVAGHDAVVITLGAGTARRSVIRSQGTLNVIQAMHAHGVRRLICQSTLGARESWPNLNFWWKRVMFGALLAPVFRDHELQEQMVAASGLDWTIVRPSAFTDAATRRPVIEDVSPAARGLDLKIARADLARFLSRQLGETTYLGRAVGLSS
ncbi:NAD(P)-binding oxidoreductase [Martelella sp. AD-3]|uniref:NAD(P)-dependent oxidoreductase n=1 Tax=Martelella sp. AD-3 TaxID=686597 RepID=UPI00046347F5|nr:NAD(P)-binding oxidoreductase [Martelella sp. AD-3]AMM85288.1 epimerase [Martelella sp. AD-3]MAM09994.1 epimerase [Rhizobiaceae bacterium]|tara:strand:+ start:258 stop:887 length:630 start_codon:yes stop_codon:yes gene_type:complete